MQVTKKEIFQSIMQNFGIGSKIKETKKYLISGRYKYYKESDMIVKEFTDVEYIGGKYEKVKKVIVFVIEKTLGIIRLINKENKKIVINFSHKSEPLVLV